MEETNNDELKEIKENLERIVGQLKVEPVTLTNFDDLAKRARLLFEPRDTRIIHCYKAGINMVSEKEKKDFQKQEWQYNGGLYYRSMKKTFSQGHKYLAISFSSYPLRNSLEESQEIVTMCSRMPLILTVDNWDEVISTNSRFPLKFAFFSTDGRRIDTLYLEDEAKSGTPQFPYERLYWRIEE